MDMFQHNAEAELVTNIQSDLETILSIFPAATSTTLCGRCSKVLSSKTVRAFHSLHPNLALLFDPWQDGLLFEPANDHQQLLHGSGRRHWHKDKNISVYIYIYTHTHTCVGVLCVCSFIYRTGKGRLWEKEDPWQFASWHVKEGSGFTAILESDKQRIHV